MSAWRSLKEDFGFVPMWRALAGYRVRTSLGRGGTVAQIVRDAVRRRPDRILLSFESETLSCCAFQSEVNAFAWVFRQAGVGREPVALVMEDSRVFLVATVAAARVGAVAAWIDSRLSGGELSHALRLSGARHVFTDAACLPRVVAPPESASLTVWGRGDPAELPPHVEPLDAACAAAPRSEPATPDARPEDPFLLLCGTGAALSRGRSTLVRQGDFVQTGVALGAVLELGPESVLYAPLPLTHEAGAFLGFAAAFVSGATLASRRRFCPESFVADVRRLRASHFVYSGSMCRALLQLPPSLDDRDHRSLTAVGTGLRSHAWERFRERFGVGRIVEVYGSAENRIGLINVTGRVGSVGRPPPPLRRRLCLARCEFASGTLVRDEHGRAVPCPTGEVGELLLRSAVPSSSGASVPRRGASSGVAHDVARPGDAYVRTGDLFRRDADGYYEFVGRLADAFVVDGTPIFPELVAGALSHASGVSEAVVYRVRAPDGGRALPMAALALESGGRFDAAGFYGQMELREAERPAYVRITVGANAGGTLDRRTAELQRWGLDARTVGEPVYVRDDAQRTYVMLNDAGQDASAFEVGSRTS